MDLQHVGGLPDSLKRRNSLMQSGRDRLHVVRAVLVWQLIGCVLIAAATLVFGFITAYSVLLGGLICLLPNCYFAYKAFRFRGARAARHIVRSFYAGEAGKLMLTAIMFASVFIGVKPLNAVALFSGYFVVILISWVVPLIHDRTTRQELRD